MIKKAKINFYDDNVPDIGSIAVDDDGDLILLTADIYKLNALFTKSVITTTYGTEFPFKSGDVALVVDATRLFMYEASSDSWYEMGV